MTKIEVLRKVLSEHVVTVTFTKLDGSTRVMKCTLRPDMIPLTENGGDSVHSDTTTVVYDLEKQAWRSFRNDSVIGYQ